MRDVFSPTIIATPFSPTVGATIKKPKSSKISQTSLKALDVALRNLGVALRYFSRAEFLAPHLFEILCMCLSPQVFYKFAPMKLDPVNIQKIVDKLIIFLIQCHFET